MKNNIAKVFNLQGLKISETLTTEEAIILKVTLKKKHIKCPTCGRQSRSRYEKGKLRRVKHQYWGRKLVVLEGNKSRWWCERCRKAFTETWPEVRKWSRKTKDAEMQILDLAKSKSFRQLQNEYGITDRETRYLIHKIDPTPKWEEEKADQEIRLGIDEHSFMGRDLVISITNLGRRQLKGILRDDKQKSLRDWINAVPEDIKSKIKEVCIDMKESFLAVIKSELPSALPVVDHFHVIQDANRRLLEARGIEKDARRSRDFGKRWWFLKGRERLKEETRIKLDILLDRYPSLKEFYTYKEQLRDLYRLKNREEAFTFLSRIILNMECSDDAAINQWGRTLKHWRLYILNYFQSRTTNAFTEGVNTKIKMIKRLSFGFRNIDIYIRKMMLAFVPLSLLWALNYPTIC